MNRSEAGKLGQTKAREKLKAISEAKVAAAKGRYVSAQPRCRHCQASLTYRDFLLKKAFCGHSCSATFNNARKAKNKQLPCKECGVRAPLTKASSFCSNQCYSKDKRRRRIEQWVGGEIDGRSGLSVRTFVRRWLEEQRGEKCWECGWERRHPTTGRVPIQINHKDGNYLNCRPENLELLCPSCHSLTPNFGNLNRGKGRKERYNPSH